MATYREEVIADSPVAMWRLDETLGATSAADSVGSHTGTYVNTPTQGVAAATAEGTATTFARASSEYMSTPDSPDWDATSTLTVEAWIKFTTLPTAINQFYTTFSRSLTSGAISSGDWSFYPTFSTVIRLECELNTTANTALSVAWSPAPTVGPWYHIAMVYNGTVARFYVNGAQMGTDQAKTGALGSATHLLYLAGYGGAQDNFDGTMDEVAVYRAALTQTRLAAHYAAAANAPGGAPIVRNIKTPRAAAFRSVR